MALIPAAEVWVSTTPNLKQRLTEWIKQAESRLAALEKTWADHREDHLAVVRSEAGQQSPPTSGRPTTEAVPPGETALTITAGSLGADFTWTPTGITCTIRGTLPLPQPDQIPPGPVEFT